MRYTDLLRYTLLIALVAGVLCRRNPEENEGDDDVFEGDMMISAAQRRAAENGRDVMGNGRGAPAKYGHWPNGLVSYVIDSSLEKNRLAREAIRKGMHEWTSKTCIRFKKVKPTKNRSYVRFYKGKGCKADVGYKVDQERGISLGKSGCWKKGKVVHEIGHAIELLHEQSRLDRDDYVKINLFNVLEERKNNFKKYPKSFIDSLGQPYDYGSVMHYGEYTFSKKGKVTIVPLKKEVSIGQRRGLSKGDTKQVKLMYNCKN